jgi:hypothetical protein
MWRTRSDLQTQGFRNETEKNSITWMGEFALVKSNSMSELSSHCHLDQKTQRLYVSWGLSECRGIASHYFHTPDFKHPEYHSMSMSFTWYSLQTSRGQSVWAETHMLDRQAYLEDSGWTVPFTLWYSRYLKSLARSASEIHNEFVSSLRICNFTSLVWVTIVSFHPRFVSLSTPMWSETEILKTTGLNGDQRRGWFPSISHLFRFAHTPFYRPFSYFPHLTLEWRVDRLTSPELCESRLSFIRPRHGMASEPLLQLANFDRENFAFGEMYPLARVFCRDQNPHPHQSKDIIYPTPFRLWQRSTQHVDPTTITRLLVPKVWIAGHRWSFASCSRWKITPLVFRYSPLIYSSDMTVSSSYAWPSGGNVNHLYIFPHLLHLPVSVDGFALGSELNSVPIISNSIFSKEIDRLCIQQKMRQLTCVTRKPNQMARWVWEL